MDRKCNGTKKVWIIKSGVIMMSVRNGSYLSELRMNITPEEESVQLAGTRLAQGPVLHFNQESVPVYRDETGMYWETNEEKGVIWLYYHGLAGHGYIEHNGEQIPVKAQADDAEYELRYKNKDGKLLSYSLYIGTRIHPDTKGFLIYGSLYCDGDKVIESFPCDGNGNMMPGGKDNGFMKTSFADGQLHAELDLSSIWVVGQELVHSYFNDDMNLWSVDIDFNADYTIQKGFVIEQNEKEGVCVPGDHKYDLIADIREMVEMESLCDSLTMEKLKGSFQILENTTTSITELYTLKAPNMEDANKLATSTLYYLMLYYVADKVYNCRGTDIKWSDWFGMNKEKAKEKVVDIDSRILELVEGNNPNKQVQDFLIKYAEVSLSNSYAASSDSTLVDALRGAEKRLSGQYSYCKVSDLCAYYLEGGDDTCLAKDPGYCIAIETINRYTYAKKTPGLIKYIDDKNGNWAKKLYDQCNANLQQLRITVLSGSSGSMEISHKSMMLTILDDQKHDIGDSTDGKKKVQMTYGAAIYAKVFNLQLADLANSMKDKLKKDCGSDFTEMMRQIYGILWDELQKDTSDYFSEEILKQFKEQQKKYEDLNKKAFVESCIEMTELGMELISNGGTITQVIPKIAELGKKPWAAYSATVCSILFYATSLMSLSTVFMNWDKATTAERIEAILTCVQGVANIALAGAKILNIWTLTNPDAAFADKMNAALRLRFDGEEMSTIRGLASANGETDFENVMREMGGRYSTTVTDAGAEAAQVSKTTSFFRIAEITVRAFNVLMMGFVTVMAGIEIAEEIKSGGYNISVILGIVSNSLMAISFICEGVSLVLDIVGVTCSALPIISAVAVFIGIVFQIVSSALKKPINPLAEFIKEVLVPMLDQLTIPKKEWIDKRKTPETLRFVLVA